MDKHCIDHKKAVILTCVVAVIWSLAGLNIKMIRWAPFAIAAGRSLAAALFMIPLIGKNEWRKVDRNVIGGAVCYVIFNYCFIVSTKLTSSAMAIMMQYTAPIYVVFLSWFFLKERIQKADIINLCVVFFGMFLFFSDEKGGGSLTGNIIAVFNGISFAGISIFLRLQKNGNPVLSMFWGNAFTALIGIPFMAAGGLPDGQSLLFLVIAGALASFSYALYAFVSKQLSALEIVLIPIIDPIMNPIWVFIFMGERPGVLSIIGAVIIFLSVTIRMLRKR